MKRSLLLGLVSLFLTNSVSFASPILPLNLAFNPVLWAATADNGGFHFKNQTSKTQYVQVGIGAGEIYIYTQSKSCGGSLNAQKGPFSIVCEVAPGEELAGDFDFSKMEPAFGTYQIEMSR